MNFVKIIHEYSHYLNTTYFKEVEKKFKLKVSFALYDRIIKDVHDYFSQIMGDEINEITKELSIKIDTGIHIINIECYDHTNPHFEEFYLKYV